MTTSHEKMQLKCFIVNKVSTKPREKHRKQKVYREHAINLDSLKDKTRCSGNNLSQDFISLTIIQ